VRCYVNAVVVILAQRHSALASASAFASSIHIPTSIQSPENHKVAVGWMDGW